MLLPILLLVGCMSSTFTSRQGQWRFDDDALVHTGIDGVGSHTPLVAGTLVCPSIRPVLKLPEGVRSDEVFEACTTSSAERGTFETVDGKRCLRIDGPDSAVWRITPRECPSVAPGLVLAPDDVSFDVIAPDDVTGLIDQWADHYAFSTLFASAPGAAPAVLGESGFPTDLFNPEGETFRVLQGEEVLFFVGARSTKDGTVVGWRKDQGRVSAQGTCRESACPVSTDPKLAAPWLGLTLGPRATADLLLTIGDHTWRAGTATAVSKKAAKNLSIVVAYITDAEKGLSSPRAARAVLRDAEGHAIYGAPVKWRVKKGRLALGPGPHPPQKDASLLPGPDYVWIEDDCEPPAASLGARSATLTATWGKLEASVDLAWNHGAEPLSKPEGWKPAVGCQGKKRR